MLETITGRYTIKQILKDNWRAFFEKYKGDPGIRDAVVENVKKVIACGDPEQMGFSVYECPKCGHRHTVPHTCKSRFCNSCGKVMTDNWIAWAEKNFLNSSYHHIVFSPPDGLWSFFRLSS